MPLFAPRGCIEPDAPDPTGLRLFAGHTDTTAALRWFAGQTGRLFADPAAGLRSGGIKPRPIGAGMPGRAIGSRTLREGGSRSRPKRRLLPIGGRHAPLAPPRALPPPRACGVHWKCLVLAGPDRADSWPHRGGTPINFFACLKERNLPRFSFVLRWLVRAARTPFFRRRSFLKLFC